MNRKSGFLIFRHCLITYISPFCWNIQPSKTSLFSSNWPIGPTVHPDKKIIKNVILMCAMDSCIKVVKQKKLVSYWKKSCLLYPSKTKTATFLFWNGHFSVMGIRKIINSLPLRRKIASQFSSSAYVRIKMSFLKNS
jgi:hypothetical protein